MSKTEKPKKEPEIVMGDCRRCDSKNVRLHDGHILARSFWRNYATEKGWFYNASNDSFEKKQETEYWFCHDCETKELSKLENHGGSRVLQAIEAKPETSIPYHGNDFNRFLSSVAWRLLMLRPTHSLDHLEAMRTWKTDVVTGCDDLGIHSHFAFSNFVTQFPELNKRLTRSYSRELGMIHYRIGPLVVFSYFRQAIQPEFQYALNRLKVNATGGLLLPLADALCNLPFELRTHLASIDEFMVKQTQSSDKLRRAKDSNRPK